MPIETHKVEVIKTDEFTVSVDSDVWNKKAIEEWSKIFWELEDTADVAKSLAEAVSRKGLEEFYEGFGYVKTFFRDGTVRKQWYKDKNGEAAYRTDADYTNGISITVISMDDDVESNIIEE